MWQFEFWGQLMMVQWKKWAKSNFLENRLISLHTFTNKTSSGRGYFFLGGGHYFFHFLSSSLHKVWPQTLDWLDLNTFSKIQAAYR